MQQNRFWEIDFFRGLAVFLMIIYHFIFDLKYFNLNLFLGILVLIFNKFISSISLNYKWLIPIGIRYPNFKTLDYFPLIPWFALVLFGIFIGKILYDENRKFKFINEPKIFIINIFKFLSKNSLTIYLLHQPIMIAILYLIKSIK